MRVLHLLASPFFSGPAESLALLAEAQRALGHDVSVAVDRTRQEVAAEELAAPRLEARGLLAEVSLELSVKSSPAAVVRDLAALRRQAVDVLHCHFSHDHLLARFARAPGVRLVRSVHAPRSLRWSLPAADAFTVPTEELARRLLGRRVLVLPPLVDPAFAAPADRPALRRRLGLPEGRVVGMVSTFQRSRRHALGVEAFARLAARAPDVTLALVGDGAELEATRFQVDSAGLTPRVVFPGYQAGADFVAWLQALDEVWVLGLGNDYAARVAAQARQCGVRVVAVDEGGLSRFADALVAPDAEAISAASLTEPPEARPIESNESIARRVLDLYEEAGP